MSKDQTTDTRKPAATLPARHAIDPADTFFLTAAEARGEAAYLVMHAFLRRIPRGACKSVMAQAYAAADSLGVEAITAEVDALFANIEFSDQA